MGNPIAALQNGMARIQNAGSAASGGFTGGGALNPALTNLMGKVAGKFRGAPRPPASNVPSQVSSTGINPSEGPGFISPMIGSAPPIGMAGGGTNAPMAMAPGAMSQFTSPQMGGMPPGYTGRGNAQRRMPGQRPVKY